MIDYKELLLQFIGSLTLCDHMGDVANDIDEVLKKMEIDVKWECLEELPSKLKNKDILLTTLHGTDLTDE